MKKLCNKFILKEHSLICITLIVICVYKAYDFMLAYIFCKFDNIDYKKNLKLKHYIYF